MLKTRAMLGGVLPFLLLTGLIAGCSPGPQLSDNSESPNAWVEEQNRTFREQSDKSSREMEAWSKSVSAPTPMPEPATPQQIRADIQSTVDVSLDKARAQLEQSAASAPAQAQPGYQRAQETLNEIGAKFKGR